MKKLVLLLLMLILSVFAASIGFGASNSAPNGECYVCHTGASDVAELTLKGLPKQYEPGKTYKLKLTVTSKIKSMSEFKGGFSAEVSAGELLVTDKKNTQFSDPYITHTIEGAEHREWTFAWKAPQQKSDVELKIMAVAADGDYAPTGDAVTAEVFTITSKK